MGGVDQPNKTKQGWRNDKRPWYSLCQNAAVSQRLTSYCCAVSTFLQQRAVLLTCGAQTVIQQLGGQEACGTGRTRCLPTACWGRPCRRDSRRVKHPESILPLFAELIAGPWARAEEIIEERHVTPLTVLLIWSQPHPCRVGQTAREEKVEGEEAL